MSLYRSKNWSRSIYALQNLGFSAVGIDIVECKPLVEVGDMHNLNYPDNSFDFIFCNILDHSLYPEKSISEMERVLKKKVFLFFKLLLVRQQINMVLQKSNLIKLLLNF